MPIIEATGLTKRFEDGTKALKGISFSIVGGKITGLVGPDGAGKKIGRASCRERVSSPV